MVKSNGSAIGTTPRWVKVQGAVIALLILVVVAMSSGLLGGHGLGGGMLHGHEQMDGH